MNAFPVCRMSLFVLVGLSALASRPVLAGIKPIAEVTAKGAAPIEKGQVTQARERAVHDALRRAVETGVGMLLVSESSTHNMKLISDSIYARAEGFVERYDVLDESKTDDMYHITIRARVQKATLASRLVDLLVLDQQMGMPQVMVLVSDDGGEYGDAQASGRTVLVKKFTEKRFRLINPQVAEKLQQDRSLLANLREDKSAAVRLANEHAAELVIVCTLRSEDKGSARGLAQAQAVLRMMAINPTTGQEFIGEESELTGAGDVQTEAARAAARRVAEEAGDYAINQMVLWWIRQAGPGAGQEYTVELQNPGNLLRVGRPFREAVERVQGVRQVKVESQSKELLRLRVLFEGGGKGLLIDGIADKCGAVAALTTLDLVLDRGNQLVFALEREGGSRSADNEPGEMRPMVVAIVPFRNATDWAQLDSTAEACARRAESVCVKAKDLRVVDRSRLDVVLKESDLAAAGIVEGDAIKLGKLLPADAIVLGEISGQKQTLRVFLRIVRTDSGEVLTTAEAEVNVDDRDRLPDQLASVLDRALNSKEVGGYRGKLGLPQP
ncbi:Curli production assembly/transport component CsgG [Phycisphaerae bacterium RAS2]|nr:Curli production assembly/transport component CsgG [Phycisphaerae bacterium RAS2]